MCCKNNILKIHPKGIAILKIKSLLIKCDVRQKYFYFANIDITKVRYTTRQWLFVHGIWLASAIMPCELNYGVQFKSGFLHLLSINDQL